MKPLLPVFCRPIGYAIIALALFMPFLMYFMGQVSDANLLFYKECAKLLMMAGAIMIIFAFHKNESEDMEQIRSKAVRNAIFLTFLFVFGGMLYKVSKGDVMSFDSSSFLTFLLFDVLCLEFGIKKTQIDRHFHKNGR